jgi:hypothetical protein
MGKFIMSIGDLLSVTVSGEYGIYASAILAHIRIRTSAHA